MKRQHLNRWLLLYLLSLMEGCKNKEIRLQCIVFQLQVVSRQAGSTKTFNYPFVRWHMGAYSKELSEDIAFLLSKGLINKEDFQLTQASYDSIKQNIGLMERFFYLDEEVFLNQVKKLKEYPIKDLLSDTYESFQLKSKPMGKRIEDIKYDEESV